MPARIMRLLNAATSGDHHATPWFYVWVGVILAIITLAEVWIFTFETLGPWFVPVLLILSLLKFVMVVAFFMHLRFQQQAFRLDIRCRLHNRRGRFPGDPGAFLQTQRLIQPTTSGSSPRAPDKIWRSVDLVLL